jgi:choline dehydrogenase-like flavoprotein
VIVDAHKQEVTSDLETGVCLVGAGAAGITLARALEASGIDCVLLEGGGFVPRERSSWELYRGDVTASPVAEIEGYLQASRLRWFGGSTNHWVGWCRPLDLLDFEPRPWIPHSGWPLRREDLDPFYRSAADVLQIEPFDRTPGPAAHEEAFPGSDGDFERVRFYMSPPTRMGERYRGEIEHARHVRALLHANVVTLETDADKRRLEAVRVLTIAGAGFRVRARAFVLAMGGIENARLLLASNVGNDHDLVGRFFMDHPHVIPGQVALTPPAGGFAPFFFHRPPDFRCSTIQVLSLTERAQRRNRLANADLHFRSLPGFSPESSDRAGSAVARMAALTEGTGRELTAAELRLRLEPVPNPESRIVLSEQKDALGVPRAELSWRLDREDAGHVEAAVDALARELGRSGWGRAQRALLDGEPWPGTSWGGHHIGTTRMHADPRQGVVDAEGRVHGVANLFVAGSSVFPTAGAANPTLTIVALALRLAKRLGQVVPR